MAKFVVSGRSDCPFYAKAELLADELSLNLPDFKVHKIVKRPDEWDDWMNKMCDDNGWKHSGSPLIWRELVDRGGKGILLGGCDDFLEFAEGYYGLASRLKSAKLVSISEENKSTKIEVDKEEEELAKKINPLRVCVSKASGPLAYGMLASLVQGEVFGFQEEVSIYLLDTPENQEALQGVAYEIEDCAWPLFRGVHITSDPAVAFKDASVVVLLDGKAINEGTDKKEYLLSHAKLFRDYGKALEAHAKPDCKVLTAGGPANFSTFIASKFAPSIQKKNFVSLSRIEENRAKGLIAKRLNVNTAGIKDLIVWGNPGFNHYPDASHARVDGFDGAIWGPHVPGFTRPVPEMVHDNKWLSGEFVEVLKKPSEGENALMGSVAVKSLLQDWCQCASSDMWSLGVISEGWYDIPEGIAFSFPVKFTGGSWQVVEGLALSDSLKEVLKNIAQEAKAETEEVLALLNGS
ncbi:predicted protein [Nematostella vectensis]|uniref:Malate dehydrogenase, cytoplasmic n=1 Tax=Nematostella vectensis TaxID=45351 RepID=A7RRY2_NEMVE|nr:predicted protein [Nematostella vectensis]|eukprot:XP_001637903.1 predicted protein [Nematostella vectensis]